MIPPLTTRIAFTRHAAIGRDLERRLADEAHLKKREQGKRRDEQEDRADTDLMEFAQAVVLASDTQVAEFSIKLDRTDAATVEALMQNEREMLVLQERIDKRLAQAEVLPDGRRVFKTEDGTRVFDEFGAEVSSEIISADEIPDHKDRFEPYWKDHLDFEGLALEREKLIEFQDALANTRTRFDEARTKTGADALTEDALADLEAEIEAATPERVRKLLDHDDVAPEAATAPETALQGQVTHYTR